MSILITVKNWYRQLQERERRALAIGGIILGVLLLYVCMWSPLSTTVENDKANLKTQRALLHYLQDASTHIQHLKDSGIQVSTVQNVNLLTLAEQTLSQQRLSSFLQQVKQSQPHQLTLIFENVPFDKLMQWLQPLTMKQGVRLQQFSAKKTVVVGTADVKMVLVM